MIEISEPEYTINIAGQSLTINPLTVFDRIVEIENEHGIEKRCDVLKKELNLNCSTASIERLINAIIDHRTAFIKAGKKKLSDGQESLIGSQESTQAD